MDFVEDAIRRRFLKSGSPAEIPLQRNGTFSARLVEGGVMVTNLGGQPFLPWAVFQEAVQIIIASGGVALRGDAMNSRLGDPGLPLDSVEGHVAHIVYRKQIGETVFRRISPISAILAWSGICDLRPRVLALAKGTATPQ
jgi:hypothetical protein